MAFFGEVTI